MYNGLETFRLASAMANHASQRQTEIARNVANANTPGYRARDLQDFATVHARQSNGGAMKATRAGHIGAPGGPALPGARPQELPYENSPNGNSVTVEREMMRAAENRQQHELALSVYRGGLNLLRTSLGRGR